jgi:hypothetical protein
LRHLTVSDKEPEMGTNYYLHLKPDCETCGRAFEPLHIGKSSGGWCFALHVIPEDSINTLDDWRALWAKPGAFVRNEYGEHVPIAELEDIITKREWRGQFPKRFDVDGVHCLGHGEGTWDYIAGKFS